MLLTPRLISYLILVIIITGYEHQLTNNSNSESRRLQEVKLSRRDIRKSQVKAERLKKIVAVAEKIPVPADFIPTEWSKPHNPSGPVIFAAAMATTLIKRDARAFVGSARQAGYKGDIVIAALTDSNPQFLNALREYDCITYLVSPECTGKLHDIVCQFKGQSEKFSINMLRYYIYEWWALKYSSDAIIMISDFRDVIFQADPFVYKAKEWMPPVAQMVIFQEAFPNKVIYRCPFNSGWILGCYGRENLEKVQSNTVSCSGVSIGTRDAVLAYSHLLVQQLDPRVRYGRNTTVTDNRGCISLGMDQGLHNWLVYSGQLGKYVDLKIYQQGEGPVNTIGAFFGERAILKFPLSEWKVLRGESPNKFFYNWNGDKSPVIHQYDRFMQVEFQGAYEKHIAVLKDIGK